MAQDKELSTEENNRSPEVFMDLSPRKELNDAEQDFNKNAKNLKEAFEIIRKQINKMDQASHPEKDKRESPLKNILKEVNRAEEELPRLGQGLLEKLTNDEFTKLKAFVEKQTAIKKDAFEKAELDLLNDLITNAQAIAIETARAQYQLLRSKKKVPLNEEFANRGIKITAVEGCGLNMQATTIDALVPGATKEGEKIFIVGSTQIKTGHNSISTNPMQSPEQAKDFADALLVLSKSWGTTTLSGLNPNTGKWITDRLVEQRMDTPIKINPQNYEQMKMGASLGGRIGYALHKQFRSSPFDTYLGRRNELMANIAIINMTPNGKMGKDPAGYKDKIEIDAITIKNIYKSVESGDKLNTNAGTCLHQLLHNRQEYKTEPKTAAKNALTLFKQLSEPGVNNIGISKDDFKKALPKHLHPAFEEAYLADQKAKLDKQVGVGAAPVVDVNTTQKQP